MTSVIPSIISGLEIGSIIAISAIGFTLVYGLNNMINFAHAEFMTIGAFLGIIFIKFLNLSLLLSLILVTVCAAVTGWIIARIFYYPLRNKGPISLLFTSIGVAYILRYGIQLISGSRARFFQFTESYTFSAFGGFSISFVGVLTITISIMAFLTLHMLLERTRLGLALRAMSANKELASITGVDTDFMRNYVWLLSSGLAGLSGVLLGMMLYVIPSIGFLQIIIIIAAAILGGAGSPYGAIVGSYLLGLTISVSTGVVLPDWGSDLGTTIAFLILVVVLIIKPGGIAGKDITTQSVIND